MYSQEIQRYFEDKNYRMTALEYFKAVWGSSQITSIVLNEVKDFYHIKTIYTNDGYVWTIYILNYFVEAHRVEDIP